MRWTAYRDPLELDNRFVTVFKDLEPANLESLLNDLLQKAFLRAGGHAAQAYGAVARVVLATQACIGGFGSAPYQHWPRLDNKTLTFSAGARRQSSRPCVGCAVDDCSRSRRPPPPPTLWLAWQVEAAAQLSQPPRTQRTQSLSSCPPRPSPCGLPSPFHTACASE
jgi:hypothetical protein